MEYELILWLQGWAYFMSFFNYICVFLFLFIRIGAGIIKGFVTSNQAIFDKKQRCSIKDIVTLVKVTDSECIFECEGNGKTYIIDKDNTMSNIDERSVGNKYDIYINENDPEEFLIEWDLKGQYKLDLGTIGKGVNKEIWALILIIVLWSKAMPWI